MTKKEVYKLIAESANYGNLGLFIGAGFSIAVSEISYNFEPLSWAELLERICIDNGILWNPKMDSKGKIEQEEDVKKDLNSCPEIASQICNLLRDKNDITFEEAVRTVKEQICNITSWYSNKEQRDIYGNKLKSLSPNWIVTTNYDLILETLLPEESISLSPKDEFVFPRNRIPIYHLHGIRSEPENIVITNEDYIALSRPHNYRMERLAFLFSESTTLMIGYRIGDQNVLTALDWSKNIYDPQNNNNQEYPHNIIQIVYTDSPRTDAYKTEKGILILETNSLIKTLDDIIESIIDLKDIQKEKNNSLDTLRETFLNPNEEQLNDFLSDENKRHEILTNIINDKEIAIASESFLSEVFNSAWEATKPDGAFEAYADILNIFIDIFKNFELQSFPPSIVMFFISNFERLCFYVNDVCGTSYKAYDIWKQEKDLFLEKNKEDIKTYSRWNWRIYSLLKRSNFISKQ